MPSRTIPGPEPGLATREGPPGQDADPVGPGSAVARDPDWAVVRRFPATCESVGLARHFLVEHLGGGSDEDVALVVLMLSELATNAVQHAATEFEVAVTVTPEPAGRFVVVCVRDQAPGFPSPQEPPAEAPHGRGLRIVDALANAWGVEVRGERPGKTVWFAARVGVGAAWEEAGAPRRGRGARAKGRRRGRVGGLRRGGSGFVV